MTLFLLRRCATLLGTLLLVSLVVFAVMNVLPGDPALVILGLDATPEAVAALREELGLNDPLILRYLSWIGGAVWGDFGVSFSFDLPVSVLIAERLPITLALAGMATVLTVSVALALGLFAASRHGRPGDWGIMVLSQLGIAIPAFWLGMLLILLVAVQWRLLPPGGFPGWSDPVQAIRALILPTVALALVQSAILTRVVRSSVLEVMRLDFARTARAKGLSRAAIFRRHILPNALVPIITIVGMQVANLVTGTIVIENVFSLPGLGRLVFQAISNRDLYMVQALVLLFAAVVVIANFLVDVAYALIDPRLQERLS
ncbi:ABC transporter permease [Thalassococcus sp. S3]|uniref:ABC transporter permease n=1 Tax=Thalassococcus sp. S3 TaxID=2017482 RepID=UPI0010245FD2|nr:ABC transporter permease [Thalassococcus sp. S3]QBF32015.1 ABC transporter permease [Thalassococcus sp. S3]